MKKCLLVVICLYSSYSNTNAQSIDYEVLTYKTKPESSEKTLLQRFFPSKKVNQKTPETRTISAKILVKGKASLYEVDAYPGKCNLGYGTSPFYFIKTDEGTFPLIHHDQGGNTYAVSQPYIGMLRYLLRDWDKREYYINLAKYNSEGLSRVIEYYNKQAK